jgi:hypothetical protein
LSAAATQAFAQSNTDAAPLKGLSPAQTATNKGPTATTPFEDRLIEDGTLQPDIWSGDVPEHDARGLPRALRLDGIYSNISRNGSSLTQYGLGVGAFLATPQYGAWTFDGVFGRTEDSFIATLWQRDMPFEDGWRASNGLGTLNTPSIDLARFQPRWYLPTSPMLGALTEWRNPRGIQLNAGAGQPGVFTGLYVPGFKRLDGTLATLGGQWSIDRNWSAGLQYAGAHDASSVFQTLPNAQRFNTDSWFGALNWQDTRTRFQFNALSSDNSFTGSHAGGWLDGQIVDGRFLHGFGVFYLGPDLVWANQPVGSDAQGAYYRINYASRQWLWDAMIDYSAPISSGRDPITYFSGSTRYQMWQDLGLGAGGNARVDGGTAWSAFAFVENSTPLLVNRSQVYTARNGTKRDWTLTLTQTWNVPAGTRLSTTLLAGRFDDGDLSSKQFGASVFGGGDIARNLTLDVNVQYLNSIGDAQPTSVIGNVGLTWRFLPELSLLATLYRSQTRSQFPLLIQSPLDPVVRPSEDRINDRGGLLILRYERRAGSLPPPLGGAPGMGAGRITGVVFLDANDSGRLDAGENGAANVTVILDGRYSARTDAQGRFDFLAVAAGRHVITVLPDNVPLPWSLVNDGRREIDVPVRGAVNLDIPAQRLR